MQNMVILGATGSIGASTLSVISANPSAYRVYALVANASVDKMLALCLAHRPQVAHMVDPNAALALKTQLPAALNIQVTSGEDELIALVTSSVVDTVMAAIVGAAGLVPTLAAVKAGKRVLLANKEALVMSGELFIEATKRSGATLLPVDSEHNAIFQCLPEEVQANLGRCDLAASGISHILLTGSGGPFLSAELSSLAAMTPAQACKHPNWSMGPKISVDSATMMNKGLEFIEARWLFNTQKDQLKVVIHPQSVIHSMVQYRDGSVIAQMGNPDMRTPIAHCMSYPQRIRSGVEPLDFFKVGQLSFCEPDFNRFPCLALAIAACAQGQEATTVLNAANEIAVEAFLQGKIGFTHIAKVNEACLSSVPKRAMTSIEDIIALDAQTRIYARELLAKFA
ncbi:MULTISPECIES: 1-deoxy-D-xylulose-5-phosphate reductoisomerase [Shewanella]|jgi:1-deoxy-D-xylulose-5-phosphate reductoisomerase|uniref:1-deoxy-D-xylulose-5-phosphate reductoisomerase n=1 Tax=Shewanella TaxID=22 RepID=UPI000B51D964|nr:MULTISPECIES: 1-deoxy-D-xylulose-5-phosphate reductoisomerase [Shewanella]PZP33101.1 MAG: 1-deoxy-D-xylulose-5-phosphate reductoisomerase [Shewanella oneidensis]ASF14947.1 1-deoxy-D-xylulose-5-phosphate reductoisomerase [Shewanella sp. FDAARGOS_354]MBW0297394.1 1-deoxy-D-xylulose-5-phosphate reductoisomerase [Shewanella xiamenensis]MCT8861837.1 1-deoxy-D-xylulose-5-phosphate reductoisomerase [Shewanella xiamenensis]MCT8874634.1 1-deoxy-D-xylulose-5-phosphate reductoisomerase [Shewanella xia